MAMVTAREFNHDVGAAKRAAVEEPVIVTDRGEPAFVLLSADEYRRLTGARRTIVELLWAADDTDFEAPRIEIDLGVAEL